MGRNPDAASDRVSPRSEMVVAGTERLAVAAPAPAVDDVVASTPGDVTGEIVAAFHAVYHELGFGFVESVYVRAMAIELFQRRVNVAREVPVTVFYKGVTVGSFRADLVVADAVAVSVKTGDQVVDADREELLNFLRCSGREVGIVLYFGPRAVLQRVANPRDGAGRAPVEA